MYNFRHALSGHVNSQVWPLRGLVIVVHTGEALDLPSPGFGVRALAVRALAVFERSRNVDQEKVTPGTTVLYDCVSGCIARIIVWGNRCRNDSCSRTGQFRRNVWAAPSDGAPWMKGGTYMVYRRVRLDRRLWDDHALGRQEHAIGRHKVSGAPFGGTSEFDPVDPELLPPRCHVRLANPRLGAATKQELVLRRSYSYLDGYRAELAAVDAGLAFICFQRFPARQFVPIQRRLADADPLNAYLTHTASGQFAIPPGVPAGGGFPGQDLFRP